MSICPLVDADYVGALLGVSRARVYQLVRENRIPFIRISERRVKFDTRRLDEFVRQGGALKQEPGTSGAAADQAVSRYDATRHSSDAVNSCLTSSGGSNDAKQRR